MGEPMALSINSKGRMRLDIILLGFVCNDYWAGRRCVCLVQAAGNPMT